MYRPDSPLGILIIDATDRFGQRIILEESRFYDHIANETGHMELIDGVDAIVDTIQNPHWILQSSKNENRNLYIGKSQKSIYPNMNIKTVVDNTGQGYGFIVTSMFQKKVNLEKEGVLIYDKTRDSDKS